MTPSRSELALAARGGIVEPSSIVPGRTDHIPFGRAIVDPMYLEPGDMLGLVGISGFYELISIDVGWMRFKRDALGNPSPVPPVVSSSEYFEVRPDQVVEGPLMLSSVSYVEFLDGYVGGFDSFVIGIPAGKKSKKAKPTDFGRGFACGCRDAEKKVFRCSSWAYNAEVRRLRAMYPAEHWARPPSSQAEESQAWGWRHIPRATRKNGGGNPS